MSKYGSTYPITSESSPLTAPSTMLWMLNDNKGRMSGRMYGIVLVPISSFTLISRPYAYRTFIVDRLAHWHTHIITYTGSGCELERMSKTLCRIAIAYCFSQVLDAADLVENQLSSSMSMFVLYCIVLYCIEIYCGCSLSSIIYFNFNINLR